MEELNDKDFDQIFKSRISEELPAFEEESWLKMEEKLRKRDRLVIYKYASIILILLSFGLASYLMTKKPTRNSYAKTVKKHQIDVPATPTERRANHTADSITEQPILAESNQPKLTAKVQEQNSASFHPQQERPVIANLSNVNTLPIKPAQLVANNPTVNSAQNTITTQPDQSLIAQQDQVLPGKVQPVEAVKKSKIRKKIPLSFALSAGPDLSSTSRLIGGRTGMNLGFSVGVGLTKKLSVQTGLNYGTKNYDAGPSDYQFNNPYVTSLIANVDASCNVLEIPLRAAYKISENNKNSIEINTGLSSYLMLNEKYVYVYTPASGAANRITEVNHKNNHILSVIDLSATYNIKLKNKKFALGIEPYVKIPLSGIGEGNVPLKSSGVSFKIRYDVHK